MNEISSHNTFEEAIEKATEERLIMSCSCGWNLWSISKRTYIYTIFDTNNGRLRNYCNHPENENLLLKQDVFRCRLDCLVVNDAIIYKLGFYKKYFALLLQNSSSYFLSAGQKW